RRYDEPRNVSFGFIGPRLYALVWTPRGTIVRVISLRKANRREIKRYVGHP
ncbi:MAG: BrnT family toxin, partial [Pseudomonadota bacterium]